MTREPERSKASLPTGTVTFLFTDIEGSTRLLQRLGDGYKQVLADHARLIRGAVKKAGGVEVNAMGDGFFVAFANPIRAIQCAVAAQRQLASHAWPEGGFVRVRMGLHTGIGTLTEEGYVGLDVHRAARICGAGYGGQILISNTVQEALGSQLSGFSLRSLGRHRLKDIEKPEVLFQVVARRLLSDFPPPRSLDARPHNLPSEVTDFIGRQAELTEIKRLLGASRMVTLLGPGGTGKTRLALRVANEILEQFDDGVFFVPLASIRDARNVAPAIVHGLGLRDTGAKPALDALSEHLNPKKILLVLDNCEQVIEAAPDVGVLLAAAPMLKVLATSRERLRLSGEQSFAVPPLKVPAADDGIGLEQASKFEAVDLFVRRARAMDANFTLTTENAPTVTRIVARLEGMPLAIELAAARCRLLPPETLATRLDQRFQVLRGGPQDLPPRHRALRDTIRWSYDLLNLSEQALLRRLGIFIGGFTLEAAETVAAGAPIEDVVEALGSLLDKSLLGSRAQHGEGRLVMLESIRDFALEELAAAGETQQVSTRHKEFYLALVEESEPYLNRQGQVATIDRLAADLDNIRAALRVALEASDVASGLRLAGASWRFWQLTGRIHEGRRWLDKFLDRAAIDHPYRAKGLVGLAGLLYWQGDYSGALARYKEALALYGAAGDRLNEADTLFAMSTTLTWSGDPQEGGRLADRALAAFQTLGVREKIGMVFMAQGFARWMQGDLVGARPLWEKSLAIALEVGDVIEATVKRLAIASIDFNLGRRREALKNSLEALDLLGAKNLTYTIMALDWVAAMAVHGDAEGGIRLAAAAAKLRAALGGGMRPEDSGLEGARVVAARHLDAATLDRVWGDGEQMNLDQAVAFAHTLDRALASFAGAERSPVPSG
jgi:predicted ATPase/class 3 adenylate cyclase